MVTTLTQPTANILPPGPAHSKADVAHPGPSAFFSLCGDIEFVPAKAVTDWFAGSPMGKAMRRFVGAAAAVWAMTLPAMPADILPVLPGPPVAPIVVWTGCYAGGNFEAGLASDNISWVPNAAGFPISAVDLNSTGTANALYMTTNVGGGGQAGCNYQTGAFVWGAEGDFDYTGVNGTRSAHSPGNNAPSFGVTETVQSNWLSTIRGRAGLADGPWMLYATGGVAFARVQFSDSACFPFGEGGCNAASSDQVKTGWTVGGGVEWAFAPRWSVKAEYLHVNLGNVSYTSANSLPAVNPLATILHNHILTEDIGRLGLNARF
jgi:outer membrane immunogenic protein